MNRCDPDMLTSYVDGALSDTEARRVATHLSGCPACADTVRAHRAIKERVAAGAALIAIPSGLAARVGTALDRVPPPGHGGANGPARPFGGWRGLGLPLGIAVLVTSAGLWLGRPFWQPRPVDVTALMWHHREAMRPPADASLLTGDPAAARAWARLRTGQISAAPSLPVRLRGVGVCRVGDAPSVLWMYDAGGHPVSLIEILDKEALPAWPEASSSMGRAGWRVGAYGGYHAIVWRQEGRTYALVSDLPPDRLMHLLEKSP